MVEIYQHKGGHEIGLRTDALTEEEFVPQIVDILQMQIESKSHDEFWSFYMSNFLKAYNEVVCSLRGYKANVVKRQIVEAGHIGIGFEAMEKVASADDNGITAANNPFTRINS